MQIIYSGELVELLRVFIIFHLDWIAAVDVSARLGLRCSMIDLLLTSISDLYEMGYGHNEEDTDIADSTKAFIVRGCILTPDYRYHWGLGSEVVPASEG